MDMHELAERLAQKAKAAKQTGGDDLTPEDGPRAAPRSGGRAAKPPSEQRAAVARKATTLRSSAPRRSGK